MKKRRGTTVLKWILWTAGAILLSGGVAVLQDLGHAFIAGAAILLLAACTSTVVDAMWARQRAYWAGYTAGRNDR